MVGIRLQDPGSEQPVYLLEDLIAVAREASSGAGAFAFASRDGARLLLRDADFQAFLQRGALDLVVGIDAITNVPAIGELAALADASPNLTVRVFVHDREALFHPKL